MIKKAHLSLVVLLAFSICGVGSAFGDIITLDFDPDDGNYHQLDNAPVKSLSKTGGGYLSANAVNIGFDTTGTSGGNFNYFTNLGNSFVGTAVSNSASDYSLSFDIVADGLAGANAELQTTFKLNGTQFQTNLFFKTIATGTYSNVSLNLGDLTATGTAFSASQVNTTTGSRQLQFINFNLTDAWGVDSGNGVRIDNIRLIESASVPEPTSLFALGAIAGLTLIPRKRRAH